MLSILGQPASAQSSSLEDGARALASRVISSVRGASVTCEQRNLSSLGAPEFAVLDAAFQGELQRGGVKILPRKTGTVVVLTISGNLTDYLGTAEIVHEGRVETFIESLGHAADSPSHDTQTAFAIQKEFLFGQEEPMVDVVLSSDLKDAEVLGLLSISSYKKDTERWTFSQSEHLPIRRTSSRELRGYLDFELESTVAFLPGELCTASMTRKSWNCETYREHLPVRGVSPGLLANRKMTAWWSAAQLEVEGITNVVTTGQDGVARLYEEGPNAVAEFSGWGSEIASLHDNCGNDWQLLVTAKTDRTKSDTVRAVEIQAREARDVSPPLELPGPIIALHTPMVRSAENALPNASAIAIVRNLQTGRYEAYRLTISCGN